MPDWFFFLDDLRAVCPEYCLRFWQVVGNWLAAFGTLSAVIISLVLSRRHRPRLTVSAGIRMLIGEGTANPDGTYPEFLSISIRNVGDRPVKIDAIGWRPARWRKFHGYQSIPPQDSGITLPHELSDGDGVILRISLEDTELNWLNLFASRFVGKWPRIEVENMRVIAWTPAGQIFTGKLEKGLRDRIVAEARRQKNSR